MFQDYALFPWHTVWGNVEFGLRHGPAGDGLDARRAAARACSSTSISSDSRVPKRNIRTSCRAACASARRSRGSIANEPDVLLMDEPLAALDAQTRIILQDELLRIWGQDRSAAERRTVVFITHAIDEAVFLADRVAVMTTHPGRLKAVIDVRLCRARATTRPAPTRIPGSEPAHLEPDS